MIIWGILPGVRPDVWGFLPEYLSETDPRPAREQFNERYQSGWHPLEGLEMWDDGSLKYTGDRPLKPLGETIFRDEIIRIYEYEWVVIIQQDGSFEASRMD